MAALLLFFKVKKNAAHRNTNMAAINDRTENKLEYNCIMEDSNAPSQLREL